MQQRGNADPAEPFGRDRRPILAAGDGKPVADEAALFEYDLGLDVVELLLPVQASVSWSPSGSG
jgi:hypothetical protein